jgi:hypothetical protein
MSGVIAQIPVFQFNNNGSPMVNGTLTTYITGTSTLSPTWQDSALTILNTNPIVLNSRGEATIWLDQSVVYRFVLKDSTGTVQWTKDNIAGSPSGLNLQGISAAGISTYTGTAALPVTDFGNLVVYSGAGNGTLTLPDVALGAAGNSMISVYNNSANLLAVTRQGSTALINVGTVPTASIILKKGETVQLLDDGTNWIQVDSSSVLGNAKAWVQFDGTLPIGAIAPRSSFNVASVTKTAVGAYTIVLANPLADPNIVISGAIFSTTFAVLQISSIASSSVFSVVVRAVSTATNVDVTVVSLSVFGN